MEKMGLSKKPLKDISESLKDYLANTYALYLKTQNFHWNVKGPEFFALHLLFEKQYKELAEAVDEIAERIVSIGFHVDATFSGFMERSQIHETKKFVTSNQMLQELVDGNELISEMGRPLVKHFQDLRDDVSADMIIKRQAAHDKAAWMLRSHF